MQAEVLKALEENPETDLDRLFPSVDPEKLEEYRNGFLVRQSIKLQRVFVSYNKPGICWEVVLASVDGTFWTIQTNLNRNVAVERGVAFAVFSGLPLYVEGELRYTPKRRFR